MFRRCYASISFSFPFRLFLIFLAIYGLTAGVSLGRHSLAPHFVYLADSFLHGRLALRHVPAPPYDLTLFDGQWYVSFPPLPALLMTPGVALWGLAFSDVAFSVALGALNVALFYTILGRLEGLARGMRLCLCALLGLGTPLWYCAALGSVWYTAHVVALTCLCLYIREALGENRPWVAGLWLGLGFLARAPVLFAFPLSWALAAREEQGVRRRARFLMLLGLGAAPALLGQAAYNWARFGDPVEFGYRWMNSPEALTARQATWGQFSLRFLPENLYTMLIRPPILSPNPWRISPDPWGMGFLFTAPILFLAARALRLKRLDGASGVDRRRRLAWGLALSAALVSAPSLLYFNTGSLQFGYRFALDWLPLWITLLALTLANRRRGGRRVFKSLIVYSGLMHLWGVLWIYPTFNGAPWHIQYTTLLKRLFLR